jgi:hypothetical protein
MMRLDDSTCPLGGVYETGGPFMDSFARHVQTFLAVRPLGSQQRECFGVGDAHYANMGQGN